MHLVACRMNPDVVPSAAEQGKRSAMEVAALAMGPGARCSLRYAPNAAKIPKYPLNRMGTNQCTVAIATAKSDRVDKRG